MALDSELRLNDLLRQVPSPGQDCFPLCCTEVTTPFMECQLCGKPLVTCLMVLTHLTRAVILGGGFDSSNQHFTAPENPVTFPGLTERRMPGVKPARIGAIGHSTFLPLVTLDTATTQGF